MAWSHRRERPVRAADLTAELNRQRLPRAETYAEVAGVKYVGLPRGLASVRSVRSTELMSRSEY